MNGAAPKDSELLAVAAELRGRDPNGSQVARVVRETFDQLYDGQRSGRYRWDQLFKTEKTHCGTLMEINLQREFKFQDGTALDYTIAGVDVDCKYSQDLYGWMIPPEAINHLCIGLSAVDNAAPTFNLGLFRVKPERLGAPNRDAKAKLNQNGRDSVMWLFRDAPIPANVLLQLDRPLVDNIFNLSSGQKRVNQLFRFAQGLIVGRGAIATVAQQDDYMKRVRANGGARSALRSEGILILGQYRSHTAIARALGVREPGRGDSISVRVTRAAKMGRGVAQIAGSFWKVARTDDVVVKAPKLPRVKPSEGS
jgi:Restriction endonuclease NaeI